jgi:threonine dehydratase
MPDFPTLEEIRAVAKRIKPYIHRTPVMTSTEINKYVNAELYFKCENFQKVGAFKFRGATNAVMSLTKDQSVNGVATHSSGNHAAALTLAARNRGIEAHIVMPKTAPEIKKKAVAAYGAHITYCEPTLESREEYLARVVEETGALFIHPYNNYQVIKGASTACFELLEDVPDLDMVIAPVGGGGLLSGTAISASLLSQNTKVIGAEPAAADDAFRSLQEGKIMPSINPITIADGLRTSLGEITFEIIQSLVTQILTAEEISIIQAMKFIWERMKIVVEPSSAVVLAVLLENKKFARGKRIGMIISGGNVDLDNLPW